MLNLILLLLIFYTIVEAAPFWPPYPPPFYYGTENIFLYSYYLKCLQYFRLPMVPLGQEMIYYLPSLLLSDSSDFPVDAFCLLPNFTSVIDSLWINNFCYCRDHIGREYLKNTN